MSYIEYHRIISYHVLYHIIYHIISHIISYIISKAMLCVYTYSGPYSCCIVTH